MFLAIDTVFDQCSVAIVSQDFVVLNQRTEIGGRSQTQQILPMIDDALNEANITLSELTALIFNRGPGAFSGIRINTAVVQALAVAQDIPCVGISSLAALAQQAYKSQGQTHVYSVLDARMKQVYFAEYKLEAFINRLNKEATEYKIMTQVKDSKEKLLDYDASTVRNLPLVGNGATLINAQNNQFVLGDIRPDATCIAELGIAEYLANGGVTAEKALPVYLRNNAWKTLKEQGKS